MSSHVLGSRTAELKGVESSRSKLLLIAKLLHEGQHGVTAKFLGLSRVVSQIRASKGSGTAPRRSERKKDLEGSASLGSPVGRARLTVGIGSSGQGGGYGGGGGHDKRKRSEPLDNEGNERSKRAKNASTPPSTQAGAESQNMPECLGTTMENGKLRGDSGHVLEQLIWGGRLKHRHLLTEPPFQEQNL